MGDPLTAADEAAAVLDAGGVAVVPTDTVYGLVARVDRPAAVARLIELKARAPDKALQVLVPGAAWLEGLARPTEAARALAAAFWPGPLTIVCQAGPRAPADLSADGTIGLRVPDHPLCREILERTGPLAASSANRSGEATPSSLDGIRATFGSEVGAYVDGGLVEGPASTVVDARPLVPVVLREGAVASTEITSALEAPEESGGDKRSI